MLPPKVIKMPWVGLPPVAMLVFEGDVAAGAMLIQVARALMSSRPEFLPRPMSTETRFYVDLHGFSK